MAQAEWLEELRARYLAAETNLFLVHGNIRDLHEWRNEDSTTEYLDLKTYLEKFLDKTRDLIAHYDVSRGLRFSKKSGGQKFRSIIDAHRDLNGIEKLEELPTTARECIPLLDQLLGSSTVPTAIVVDYFEMVAPNVDVASLYNDDKAILTALQRWTVDPGVSGTDNLVIFVTDNLTDVSRRVAQAVATIQIPFPTEEQRLNYIESQDLNNVNMTVPTTVLAKMTAGLTLVQIRNIIRAASVSKSPVNFADISMKKKRIIEQECHGLVEFIPPRHGFNHVGGMEAVKTDLLKVADAIKRGNVSRVPMGMIFVGPMGCVSGDTFVQVNRGGKGFTLTMRELVYKQNGGLTKGRKWDLSIPTKAQGLLADGTLGLVEIEKAWDAGVKTTYELLLEDGTSIRTTDEHRFWTPDGWKRHDELKIDDFVGVRGKPYGQGLRDKKLYLFREGLKYHPFAGNTKSKDPTYRVLEHRLVVEAEMNRMSFDDYLKAPRSGDVKDLVFLQPDQIVHHKDDNHKNNEHSNLEVMTQVEHARMHGNENRRNFGDCTVRWSKVISCMAIPLEEATYDLTMENSTPSYVANGMVVS
jgi:hypothetical protein